MSRSIGMRRAPFRIERDGARIEMVHDVEGHIDRYEMTPFELAILARDAIDVMAGHIINERTTNSIKPVKTRNR